MGAMGAAIATALSYIIAFTIRSIDVRKYICFDMHVARVAINTAVITAQTVIMIADFKYWIIAEIALVAFITVFNGKEIFETVITVAKKFLGKKRKNI